jgi:cell division protein FtsZ
MKEYNEGKIKVIGVGGAGCNAVTYLDELHLKNVQAIVCNTDATALSANPVSENLLLNVTTSDEKFRSNEPEIARQAALNKIQDIKAMLSDGTDILFVVAGLGGCAGTGAAPMIAQVAKKLGILTIGIVTTPFSFEGEKKASIAAEGIKELQKRSDAVLVIANNKLRGIYGDLSIQAAFRKVDEYIANAVRAIAEIVTISAEVNVDVDDVRIVLENAGETIVGTATTAGKDRASLVAQQATEFSLLLKNDMKSAGKILLSIMSGSEAELEMDELTYITNYIQDKAGPDAEVIFGHGIDENLQNSIRVTLIAAGFSDN